MAINNVLEKLQTNPLQYLGKEPLISLEQLSFYHGLYWDTYRYKANFADTAKYIYIKINPGIEKGLEPAQSLEIQHRVTGLYQTLHELYEKFQAFPGYSVTKPVLCFPEFGTLITEESAGTNVWVSIKDKAKFYRSHSDLEQAEHECYACGKWLDIFQKLTREPERDPFQFEPTIEVFDSYLSKLIHYQPLKIDNDFRTKVLDFCQRLVLDIPDEDRIVVGIHGDFTPANVLFHQNEVIALDIKPSKYGTMYWDSTYFVYHLKSLTEQPLYRPKTIKRLQTAFEQGFGKTMKFSNNMVIFCMIHNVIQSLLYLSTHRENVDYARKAYDMLRCKKCLQWLRQTCEF